MQQAVIRYVWMLLILGTLIQGCKSSGITSHQVPENGFAQSLNYQFQAKVHADEEGTCRRLVVLVRPINKLYSREAPPERLQLFDDDCLSPVRFERIYYTARQTGEQVRLIGTEVIGFWNQNFRLESELSEWLWSEGII